MTTRPRTEAETVALAGWLAGQPERRETYLAMCREERAGQVHEPALPAEALSPTQTTNTHGKH